MTRQVPDATIAEQVRLLTRFSSILEALGQDPSHLYAAIRRARAGDRTGRVVLTIKASRIFLEGRGVKAEALL